MKKLNKIDRPEDKEFQHKIRPKATAARCRIQPPAYIRISTHSVAKTKELNDGGVVVDFDKEGNVVGIELLVFSSLDL